MKKFKLLFPALFVMITLGACGGGESTEEGQDESTESAMVGAETDLSPYGFNYVITLPDSKSSELMLSENDWGGLDIMKGEMFMLSIAYGEGNLDLVKSDLQGDLVYKSEILEDDGDHLLYKREIPDSGMEPEYHFIYVFKAGSDIIEIQNSKDASFNEEAIRAMLMSAKSFKAKSGA